MTAAFVKAPLTCFDNAMEQPELYETAVGNAVYYSSRAPNKNTENEDALAIIPVSDNAVVLAVADGMGGLPAGEEASRIVMQCLIEAIGRIGKGDISVREAILGGIEQANNEIVNLGNGAGTTIAIAEIQDNYLRTYHAGDSVIMLVGNRGKIKYSTIAHSPVGYALESGIINETQAMVHEERHLIFNYIGSHDLRIEISPNLRMAPRDTLLLASDGLTDNLYESEIVAICRKGRLLNAAKKLLTDCRKYMGHPVADRTSHPDDLSFILHRPG